MKTYTITLSHDELLDLFEVCDDSIALHNQTDDEAAKAKDLWLEVLDQVDMTLEQSIAELNKRNKA